MKLSPQPSVIQADEPVNADRRLTETAAQLISFGQFCYQQGWVFGTSGNFSKVISKEPFCLVITKRGAHKGNLSVGDFLQIDQDGKAIQSKEQPSAETGIHLAIISKCGAGAVLHTHSIGSTLLSDWHAQSGGLAIHGYEMLKGLSGVQSHEHHEWLPILENSQDYAALSQEVSRVLQENPGIHGILLRRHGLYTWGLDLDEARRHVEVFEFLFSVLTQMPPGTLDNDKWKGK